MPKTKGHTGHRARNEWGKVHDKDEADDRDESRVWAMPKRALELKQLEVGAPVQTKQRANCLRHSASQWTSPSRSHEGDQQSREGFKYMRGCEESEVYALSLSLSLSLSLEIFCFLWVMRREGRGGLGFQLNHVHALFTPYKLCAGPFWLVRSLPQKIFRDPNTSSIMMWCQDLGVPSMMARYRDTK